jgi:spermidine synthase
VLIIGGGDCGIAEEVLKHKSVRHLTQVEIDPKVIAFAKEHFPEFTRPVFADKRFESVIGDGAKYVAKTERHKTERRFDVIIVDTTDPQGPGKVLFGAKFYADCRRCLNKGGVLVTQNGVPFFQKQELAGSMAKLRKLFADVTCYVAAIPTYVGGHMAMGFASDDKTLRRTTATTIARRYRKAGSFKTSYWTPEVHAAAFAQPRFIADVVKTKRR